MCCLVNIIVNSPTPLIISQLQALTKEKELLQLDAASKHEVISDLIVKNNQVLAEMNELAQWKKEVLPKLEKVSKEEIASEVLAKRIVELESDLERSRRALAGLEEALMVSDHIICSYLPSIFDMSLSYDHSFVYVYIDCRVGEAKTYSSMQWNVYCIEPPLQRRDKVQRREYHVGIYQRCLGMA